VRLLIEKIVVGVQGRSEQVKVAIDWSGGLSSHHDRVRGVQRYEQLGVQGRSMDEVAAVLHAEGFHPPKQVERYYGLRLAKALKKGEWLLGELSCPLRI
jgi:hypothetical protein